jgi:hypothetical protein
VRRQCDLVVGGFQTGVRTKTNDRLDKQGHGVATTRLGRVVLPAAMDDSPASTPGPRRSQRDRKSAKLFASGTSPSPYNTTSNVDMLFRRTCLGET